MTDLIKLDKSMIKNAKELIEQIDPQQVPIEKVDNLMKAIPYTGIVDIYNADTIVAECNRIIDKSRDYAAICKAFHSEAKRRRKAEYAKALLLRSKDWLVAHEISNTDTSRKAYADQDETLNKWADIENAWEALTGYFDNLRDDMRDRYYWFKRVFEFQKSQNINNNTDNTDSLS